VRGDGLGVVGRFIDDGNKVEGNGVEGPGTFNVVDEDGGLTIVRVGFFALTGIALALLDVNEGTANGDDHVDVEGRFVSESEGVGADRDRVL
jgi:hypothetical protein